MTELVIPTGIPSKEGKAEIEIHPVLEVVTIRKVQYNLEFNSPFCAFHLSIILLYFFKERTFCFI